MEKEIYLSSEMADEIIQLTQDLIRQNSLSGKENTVAQIVEAKLRTMDCDEVRIDEFGNVIAVRTGARRGGRILFDAHMDVVPVNNLHEWTKDPFSGDLIEGRIWGRGATDVKGGLAAMVIALGRLPRERIPGTLILSASVGEETIEGVALKSVIEYTQPNGVVIIEPTQSQLGIGQKGRIGLRINVEGKPAHTSNPEMGKNAIYGAMEVIQKIRSMSLPSDEILGRGIMELIEISSMPYPGESIVPYSCSLRFERRLVSGETMDTVRKSIEEALGGVDGWHLEFNESRYSTYTGRSVSYPEFHPAWRGEETSPWIRKAKEGLAKAKIVAKLSTIPYCTNGSYPAGILNLPTVVFGPSTIKLAHGVDEYIEVNELLYAARGLMGLAENLGEYETGL